MRANGLWPKRYKGTERRRRKAYGVRCFFMFYKFPVAAKGPKVSKGRSESPLVASAEAKSPVRRKKQGSTFSLPSISNLLLVGGFVRLRADEVLSPRGKVPKGRRGRPKGACGMAAPGPPVAKRQCAASLAGARPTRFTSVPGRATVAYGAADPFPGSSAPVYPWSDDKGPPRQEHRAAESPPGRRSLAPKKITF